VDPEPVASGIDYQRLYQFRFRGVDQRARQDVWNEIAPWLYRRMGSPERVLDAAAGLGEFVNAVPAAERWAVDLVDRPELHRDPAVCVVIGDILGVDLPEGHFDAVFASNLLEHFEDQDSVATFLRRAHGLLRPGGRMVVLGPNFRYCAREYFDCADHTLAFTHVAVEEHLYAAGFEIESSVPRFLPYSFRSRLPAGPGLVRRYLQTPLAWRLLGKQFLVIGRA
jgi:SAM-dependent methyltransferase